MPNENIKNGRTIGHIGYIPDENGDKILTELIKIDDDLNVKMESFTFIDKDTREYTKSIETINKLIRSLAAINLSDDVDFTEREKFSLDDANTEEIEFDLIDQLEDNGIIQTYNMNNEDEVSAFENTVDQRIEEAKNSKVFLPDQQPEEGESLEEGKSPEVEELERKLRNRTALAIGLGLAGVAVGMGGCHLIKDNKENPYVETTNVVQEEEVFLALGATWEEYVNQNSNQVQKDAMQKIYSYTTTINNYFEKTKEELPSDQKWKRIDNKKTNDYATFQFTPLEVLSGYLHLNNFTEAEMATVLGGKQIDSKELCDAYSSFSLKQCALIANDTTGEMLKVLDLIEDENEKASVKSYLDLMLAVNQTDKDSVRTEISKEITAKFEKEYFNKNYSDEKSENYAASPAALFNLGTVYHIHTARTLRSSARTNEKMDLQFQGDEEVYIPNLEREPHLSAVQNMKNDVFRRFAEYENYRTDAIQLTERQNAYNRTASASNIVQPLTDSEKALVAEFTAATKDTYDYKNVLELIEVELVNKKQLSDAHEKNWVAFTYADVLRAHLILPLRSLNGNLSTSSNKVSTSKSTKSTTKTYTNNAPTTEEEKKATEADRIKDEQSKKDAETLKNKTQEYKQGIIDMFYDYFYENPDYSWSDLKYDFEDLDENDEYNLYQIYKKARDNQSNSPEAKNWYNAICSAKKNGSKAALNEEKDGELTGGEDHITIPGKDNIFDITTDPDGVDDSIKPGDIVDHDPNDTDNPYNDKEEAAPGVEKPTGPGIVVDGDPNQDGKDTAPDVSGDSGNTVTPPPATGNSDGEIVMDPDYEGKIDGDLTTDGSDVYVPNTPENNSEIVINGSDLPTVEAASAPAPMSSGTEAYSADKRNEVLEQAVNEVIAEYAAAPAQTVETPVQYTK